jgi:hypothetical protein
MNRRDAEGFARREMLNHGEALLRAEPAGPFVVALVRLEAGGYQNRAAQPAVVEQNRRTNVPLVATIATYGRSQYRTAARRFNSLVDEELV